MSIFTIVWTLKRTENYASEIPQEDHNHHQSWSLEVHKRVASPMCIQKERKPTHKY